MRKLKEEVKKVIEEFIKDMKAVINSKDSCEYTKDSRNKTEDKFPKDIKELYKIDIPIESIIFSKQETDKKIEIDYK